MLTMEERLAQNEAAIAALREQYERVCKENRWLKDQIFGRSSEKRKPDIPEGQSWLFNEADALAEAEPEVRVAIPVHSRTKRGRNPIKGIDIIYDIPDEEKVSPHDGMRLTKVGEETAEQIDYGACQIFCVSGLTGIGFRFG